jgi:MFS family permease
MPKADDSGATRAVALYFGPLTFLIYLVNPINQLLDYATTFILKDQLHVGATQVSVYRMVIGLPVYVAVIFGLTRDLWSPLGRRDRGYFIIFGAMTAGILACLGLAKLSYGVLLAGMFLAMLSFRFVNAAFLGLMALVGQEKLMTGRVAALWSAVQFVPLIAGALGGGYVAEHVSPRATFLGIAALTLLIALFGLWKPRAIFAHAYDRPEARGSDLMGDIRRLVKHKAIYAPVLILFMYQFAPGSNTPLQYYLTDQLHASDAVYAEYNAIFLAAFIPVSIAYAWLCKRFTLRSLLLWGTILTVPQMIPLALIHSPAAALMVAAPIGLMGALAAPAYYDLAIRSCPPGLQGALMMLIDGAFFLSYRGGDVLGSAIYAASPRYGFIWCVALTTLVYALILPALLLAPRSVTSTREGEPSPLLEAQRAMELAAA